MVVYDLFCLVIYKPAVVLLSQFIDALEVTAGDKVLEKMWSILLVLDKSNNNTHTHTATKKEDKMVLQSSANPLVLPYPSFRCLAFISFMAHVIPSSLPIMPHIQPLLSLFLCLLCRVSSMPFLGTPLIYMDIRCHIVSPPDIHPLPRLARASPRRLGFVIP